jgi:hypothetical protein
MFVLAYGMHAYDWQVAFQLLLFHFFGHVETGADKTAFFII